MLVELDAEAVELHLMQPAVASWRAVARMWDGREDEQRGARHDPDIGRGGWDEKPNPGSVLFFSIIQRHRLKGSLLQGLYVSAVDGGYGQKRRGEPHAGCLDILRIDAEISGNAGPCTIERLAQRLQRLRIIRRTLDKSAGFHVQSPRTVRGKPRSLSDAVNMLLGLTAAQRIILHQLRGIIV